MDAKTLKALKLSIAHWKRMATDKARGTEHPGPTDCALCSLFQRNMGCNGCPVSINTGKYLCRNTPYAEAWKAYDQHGLGSSIFKAAAWKEIVFLESLLPKQKKKS